MLINKILLDADWRVSELASIKILPIKYNLSNPHSDLYIRYSIPAIYAIWEGFIKNSVHEYISNINSKQIQNNNLSKILLTHHIDNLVSLETPRFEFSKKINMTVEIKNILENQISLSSKIPTESNINLKVLNKILDRLCITRVNESYDSKLSKLLFYRNRISHGENNVRVEMKNLEEFSSLVEDLMLEVILNIESSENALSYLEAV